MRNAVEHLKKERDQENTCHMFLKKGTDINIKRAPLDQ